MPSPRSLILLLPAAAVAVALSACGAGPATDEPRSVGAFDRVEAQDGVDVRLHLGQDRAVSVRAGEHVIDDVHVKVADGTLRVWHDDIGWLSGDIVVDVRAPAVTSIDVAEGSDADVYDVTGDALSISASGGSDVSAAGRIGRLALNASGGSDANLEDLAARDASVDVSGGSDAEVRASATLDVKASGGSDVSYSGEPRLTRDVSGSSDLNEN
jgi:hypothetical protein